MYCTQRDGEHTNIQCVLRSAEHLQESFKIGVIILLRMKEQHLVVVHGQTGHGFVEMAVRHRQLFLAIALLFIALFRLHLSPQQLTEISQHSLDILGLPLDHGQPFSSRTRECHRDSVLLHHGNVRFPVLGQFGDFQRDNLALGLLQRRRADGETHHFLEIPPHCVHGLVISVNVNSGIRSLYSVWCNHCEGQMGLRGKDIT